MRSLASLPALARQRPIVTALLVLITLLGGWMRFDAIGSSTRVSVDERSYLGIANNLREHRSYAYGSDPLHWAPGTPFLFATAMELSGTGPLDNREVGASNAPLYAQAFVGTLAILAVFALAAWLGGAIPGLIAAFFTAIYDPLILVARSYLSEPLGGLFLVLAVLAICLAIARPQRTKLLCLGAGALLGLTVLTRNDMLLLFGVLPALALVMVWRREHSLRTGFTVSALIAAGAVITVLPWVMYASQETKKFTPITTAGPSSLWVATYLPAGGRQIILKRQFMDEVCRTFPDRPDACGVSATQMDMRLIFELLNLRHPELSQKEAIQAELDRNIRDYAFGQPVQFGEMLANKSTRIWGRPWGGGALGRQESSVLQHKILLGLAVLGIGAGLIWGGRRRRYILLAAAALFTVTALNTIFVSESRMSLRMTPLLFAVGIGGFGAALRARRGDDEPLAPNGDQPQESAETAADATSDDDKAAPSESTPESADSAPAETGTSDEHVGAPAQRGDVSPA
ncbi:MAG: glycosyltransferase family 39 protein [Solirubrobacteraceae bacterium]|nr:glycosyltransferase family 39 protein [Solirubrobacteraceae bacterium]